MNSFRLPVGDWSGDGHGKCDWFTVTTPWTSGDIERAFKAAKARLPHINPEHLCAEYEERNISFDVAQAMRAAGYPGMQPDTFALPGDPGVDDCDEIDRVDWPDWDTEEFARYVVWYANQGDPDLKLQLVPNVDLPTVLSTVGGYGLFYT